MQLLEVHRAHGGAVGVVDIDDEILLFVDLREVRRVEALREPSAENAVVVLKHVELVLERVL